MTGQVGSEVESWWLTIRFHLQYARDAHIRKYIQTCNIIVVLLLHRLACKIENQALGTDLLQYLLIRLFSF